MGQSGSKTSVRWQLAQIEMENTAPSRTTTAMEDHANSGAERQTQTDDPVPLVRTTNAMGQAATNSAHSQPQSGDGVLPRTTIAIDDPAPLLCSSNAMDYVISLDHPSMLWHLALNGKAKSLRDAILQLSPAFLRLYLEYTSDLDQSTPLEIAIRKNHVFCVKVLLTAGADADRLNSEGLSPLHLAVKTNNRVIAELLIHYGAEDFNVLDRCGRTPLVDAAIEGHAQVLDVLLHCGAVDIFALDPDSQEDILAIARKEIFQAPIGCDHSKFTACVDLVIARLLVQSGWIYEYSDSGTPAWRKRRYMILRTANPVMAKIDLFPESGTMAQPSVEMSYNCSNMIQEAQVFSGQNSSHERPHQFALRVCVQDAEKTIILAAVSADELTTWKDIPIQLRMAKHVAMNAIRTRRDSSSHREPHPGELLLDELVALRRQQRKEEEERAERQRREEERLRQDESAARRLQQQFDREEQQELQRVLQLSVASASQFDQSSCASPAPFSTETAECVICLDSARSAVCVPCGHVALCMDCARRLKATTRKCPVCRSLASDIIQIFNV